MPKPRWPASLSRPIPVYGGPTLRTLDNVRRFILAEPEGIQQRNSWQHATEALVAAAEGKQDIADLTERIEKALLLEMRWFPK